MCIANRDLGNALFTSFVVGEACSIILRGATQQILDEAERSLHDVLCVLTTHVREARTVAGAGASEILMSSAIVVESQKVRILLAPHSFPRSIVFHLHM